MKTTRTKKTTVITTEKREVWVVRQNSGATQQQAEDSVTPDSSGALPGTVPNEPRPEGSAPAEDANDHFKE